MLGCNLLYRVLLVFIEKITFITRFDSILVYPVVIKVIKERLNLKNDFWENYHSKNLTLLISKITDMIFNKNYNIYLTNNKRLIN